jgi:hypothetical protein
MSGPPKPTPATPTPLGNRFIVGEVSKNWVNGESATPLLLCQLFERMIATNLTRGYRLHSFQIHRIMVREGDDLHAPDLNETIIAVFEREARA